MRDCLFDGHCDTAYELWQRGEGLLENTCHIDLRKAAAFEGYAQVFAFCSYAAKPASDYLTKPLAVLRREVHAHRERIGFARNAAQIEALWRQGRAAALLSAEGAEVINCDAERLAGLAQDGFVMLTLTWNADNALAGCHMSDKGLTDQGRVFVRAAEELGILIDVSHLGENAFWELCRTARRPILASHSNSRALCAHSRNLTDDQLRAIASSGGTVGLNLYAPFVGGKADFDALRAHLERMLRLCGEQHVALGGDLDGCDVTVEGFRTVADWRSFRDYLSVCGYEDALLERLYYRNLSELLRRDDDGTLCDR